MMLCRTTLGLSLTLLFSLPLFAAPQIQNSTLRGLLTGGTTRLTLTGSELGPAPQVHVDFPTEGIRVLPESNASRLTLEIDLPSEMQPGHGNLRVSTSEGVSDWLILGIDHLPEAPFADTLDTLPVALTGSLSGSQLLRTQFTGRRGQRVVVDVEAQRIGSKLRPLVSLVDERDTQLAYSAREITTGGDARLDLILPADGTYTIKLHDVSFQGAAPGHFRMKVGTFAYGDVPFPLAIQRHSDAATLELLIPSSDSGVAQESDEIPLDFRMPAVSKDSEFLSIVPLEVSGPFSGPRPTIWLSELPEHVEAAQPAADEPQALGAVPLAVSGRVLLSGERDRYLVEVTPGTKVRAEVFAQRLRSALDAVIEVRKPDGGVLASADDQPQTSDPAVEFDVPAGVTQVEVSVHALSQSAGEAFFYRLQVAPNNFADFALHVAATRLNIPADGSAVLEVTAQRRGYRGPIELQFPELPTGVSVSLHEIPAKVHRALVTFTATQDAQGVGIGRVVGKAVVGQRTVLRMAAVGDEAVSLGEPPRFTQLALGIVRQPKLTLAWDGSLASDALQLGRSTTLQVKVARGTMQNGPVRFSLVTSQRVPQKQGQPDLEKALRLEGDPVLAAGQSEATVSLKVPAELADTAWDVAVKGELLSEDQKTVLASATTPAQRLTLGSPLFLALTGESIVRLKGKISRAGGFSGPVTVAAKGLPEGAQAPEVTIAADQTDFTLEITLSAGLKPEQLQNVQLVARASRDGRAATSNEIGIKLETGAK